MAASAAQGGKSQAHLVHRDFSSPSVRTWENERLGRCGGVGGEEPKAFGNRSALVRDGWPRIGSSEMVRDGGDLKVLREKLLGHLREAADKIKIEVSSIGAASPAAADAAGVRSKSTSGTGDPPRPWNLRTRTTAKRASAARTTVRLRSEDADEVERQRFSISLSREEIEEDIFAITGSRPRRRPKKRPRNVQGQLDMVFPGMWLSEITPEMYKVAG
ncbi:hypothetical protein HPP92_023130 [Vanilla planifolia]|uniref:DUF1639 family protein n=1 Tax=Vanilla planifolia TaxID=51239 RepID=A0A835UE66_VANPL|nr:hypothetical protein HPP92_023130 [Vanilla planifolia]